MLISNSSWITAASAFIFPAKSLQGILMTSRESLSLGHTVITHCQGGWKRTNRKFPCGKMCFISSPSSCQSSGRKTIETNYERRWKQAHWALPFPTPLPNSGPEIGMLSQAVIRGPRQKGYPAQKWDVARQDTWARQSIPAQGLQLCSSAATALCLHCILASSSCNKIFFVLPLDAFQNLAEGRSQILMTAMEVRMLLPSLLSSSKVGPCLQKGQVKDDV